MVIGAGIIGLTTTYELMRRGRHVLVVDAADPMQGCSAGNAGYLAESNIFPPASWETLKQLPRMLLDRHGPLVIDPLYLPELVPWGFRLIRSLRPDNEAGIRRRLASLTTRAIGSYAPMLQDIGAQNMIKTKGALVACLRSGTLDARARSLPVFAEHGIEAQCLTGYEASELEPALTSRLAGAILFPNSAHCINPKRLAQVLATRLFSNGVAYLKDRVTALSRASRNTADPDDVWRVSLQGGVVTGRQVVICAGRGADTLLSPLGFTVPLASERGYHLMLRVPNIVLGRPVLCAEPFLWRLLWSMVFGLPELPNLRRANDQ